MNNILGHLLRLLTLTSDTKNIDLDEDMESDVTVIIQNQSEVTLFVIEESHNVPRSWRHNVHYCTGAPSSR